MAVPAAFALVFLAALAIDYAAVAWTSATEARHRWRACIWSGVIALLGFYSIQVYIDDNRAVVPIVCGHMAGTWLGVTRQRNGGADGA